jgi:spore maturation protein SpmB
VGVRKFRHALPAGLTADFVGVVAAVFFGRLLTAFSRKRLRY